MRRTFRDFVLKILLRYQLQSNSVERQRRDRINCVTLSEVNDESERKIFMAKHKPADLLLDVTAMTYEYFKFEL